MQQSEKIFMKMEIIYEKYFVSAFIYGGQKNISMNSNNKGYIIMCIFLNRWRLQH